MSDPLLHDAPLYIRSFLNDAPLHLTSLLQVSRCSCEVHSRNPADYKPIECTTVDNLRTLRRQRCNFKNSTMMIVSSEAEDAGKSHRCIASRCFTSHRTTPHRIAPHRTASHRIASRRIASHRAVSRRIALHRVASHRVASRRVASRRIASHRVASRASPHTYLLVPTY